MVSRGVLPTFSAKSPMTGVAVIVSPSLVILAFSNSIVMVFVADLGVDPSW